LEIQISQSIKKKIQDFKIGVIFYENITVSDSPQMLKGRLQLFQESIFFDLQSKQINEIPGIQEWRTIFKQLGTDPNRYRPSVEALYRRIQKHNYLPTIHSAADINNFFSLKYEVPIGIYDLDKIAGTIEIKVGTPDDEYIALNGRSVNMDKKLLSADNIGPFGSPYVDSERTAVTYDPKQAIQIVYLKPSTNETDAKQLIESLKKMFIHVHGGSGTSIIIQ
jgi:DNA/RNA-binding domain of Phe-tRNA-synthetase-like protein